MVHGTLNIHTQHTTSQITTNTKKVQRRLHRVPLKAMDPLGMKQVLRAGALDIRADGLNEDSPPTPRNVKNRSPHAIERIVTATKYNRLQIGSPEASWKELEKSALLIYDSMEAPTRIFHTVDHLTEISDGADPIQIIAIQYHDIIYYQIDGGLSDAQRKYLHDVIVENDGKISITKEKLSTDIEMVMDVFGYTYGRPLNPYKGMNEFLSACLGVRNIIELDGGRKPAKTRSINAKIAACIEATIPWRKQDKQGRTPPEALFHRLTEVNEKYHLGWNEEETVQAVQRSADLNNRDLDAFATSDRAKFITSTWKLLPEFNIELRMRRSYYLKSLTGAMQKMAVFYEYLDPELFYISFRDTETDATNRQKAAESRQNIDVALTYLRCKLLAYSTVSAAAELSGGDAPINLFFGDRPATNRPTSRRLEDFLTDHHPSRGLGIDNVVLELLRNGRCENASFDPKHAPLAAFLYAHIGDVGLKLCVKYIMRPMDSENAWLLLKSLPQGPMIQTLKACSELAITRRTKIATIIAKLSEDSTESDS